MSAEILGISGEDSGLYDVEGKPSNPFIQIFNTPHA